MGELDKATNKAIQDLSLSLENRTFVDYFNTFLCLPVFGQHVFYNYMETEFEFEPPIKQRRHLYLDRREILIWLCRERLRLFKLSPLYTEYNLCMKLRTAVVEIPGLKDSDPDGVDRKTFTRNVIGTVTGMLLFRESLRGTNGERVYRCWKDLEAWRLIEDQARKMYWKRVIKTKYINQASTSELKGGVKLLVFQGNLNFNVVNDEDSDSDQTEQILGNMEIHNVDSDEALLHMQKILLKALMSYWLPRHILRIMTTAPKETLEILQRPAPGDLEYLDHERRLRCRFMFPTIYQESNISSPATTVFTSKSAGQLPGRTPTSTSGHEDPSRLDDDENDDYYDVDDDVEMIQVDPVDLLSLWGGPAKTIEVTSSASTSTASTYVEENESPDDYGRRNLRSTTMSAAKHIRTPIPIELSSFLGGKKRTLLGKFPKTSNRVIWSLASDILACFPFRTFLQSNEYSLDLHYLNFWTDVRNYLDADENTVNSLGQPLRRILAHGILRRYLTRDGEGGQLFSETLKMSIFRAMTTNNDVSLLCMAQDIVQESLWEPLKLYIQAERKGFLQQVRGNRYNLTIKQRRKIDMMARKSKSNMTTSESVDPMYFFNCAAVDTASPSTASPPVYSPTMPCPSAMSRPVTSYHVSITEEQMWKATELAVLCCEYGSAMMAPQHPPSYQHLVDILHSDYGSLHVSRVPAVKNEWLRNLINPPKINIETIRVSRKVYLEKIDLDAMKEEKEGEKEKEEGRQKNRMVLRRNGLVLERPTKPKSFIEVLTTPTHYDFFKRFMMVHKMGMPLMFWKGVEDLKDLSNSKTRQIRVTQIMRKFFGKYAKYGALLDCHEEIIRQIPNMDKVTPGILICAQAAVYRSMERKWYPMYLETYPPESETSSPTNITTTLVPKHVTPEFLDIVNKAKKPSKKRGGFNSKTIRLWKNIARSLLEFHKALTSKQEIQLLEIFLKCEVEKEQFSALSKDAGNTSMNPIEKNMLMSNLAANMQTRVVIRNRLVILNRLPADLRFWIEVKKYQDLVDSAYSKGDMSAQDTEFLCDKARSVISCYLASDVPPKVQINIPNDMAGNIINGLAAQGPCRGLFHDAIFLLFPMLYHYYRKFQDEIMSGDIPDEYLDSIENSFKDKVSSNPHSDVTMPDFKNVDEENIKTVHHVNIDENCMKIHFSITNGIMFIYPVQKVAKTPTHGGRRMTKHSIHALSEESSPKKESRGPNLAHGHDRRDGHHAEKIGDHHHHHAHAHAHADDGRRSKVSKHSLHNKEKEKSRKEKIVVREAQDSKKNEKFDVKVTNDRARRLSSIVESLNKEKQKRIDEQNKRYSKTMSFDEVVSAAMEEMSASNSMFS